MGHKLRHSLHRTPQKRPKCFTNCKFGEKGPFSFAPDIWVMMGFLNDISEFNGVSDHFLPQIFLPSKKHGRLHAFERWSCDYLRKLSWGRFPTCRVRRHIRNSRPVRRQQGSLLAKSICRSQAVALVTVHRGQKNLGQKNRFRTRHSRFRPFVV